MGYRQVGKFPASPFGDAWRLWWPLRTMIMVLGHPTSLVSSPSEGAGPANGNSRWHESDGLRELCVLSFSHKSIMRRGGLAVWYSRPFLDKSHSTI